MSNISSDLGKEIYLPEFKINETFLFMVVLNTSEIICETFLFKSNYWKGTVTNYAQAHKRGSKV